MPTETEHRPARRAPHTSGQVGSPTPTIGEEVRERMDRLTPSERRVGRALLAAYPIAGLGSLTQLATSAGVTGPTVLRFVRKLGFEGYPDFQRTLREEIQARMTSPLALYGSQMPDPDEEVLDTSLRAFVGGLERTFRSVPAAEFRAVVGVLADDRRRAFFTGGRFSQLVAHYLWAQLRMLRPGVRLVGQDFAPRLDELIDVGRGDVVCVFDYRRYQQDTVRFARQAAGRRATVILFTDPWLSPAADVAAHVLTSHPDSPSPLDSMVGALALTEAVVTGVVAELGERGRSRVEELERVRAGDESAVDDVSAPVDGPTRGRSAERRSVRDRGAGRRGSGKGGRARGTGS